LSSWKIPCEKFLDNRIDYCYLKLTFFRVLIKKRDIVKSFMKNRSITYGKIRKTLPLEGGGKGWG